MLRLLFGALLLSNALWAFDGFYIGTSAGGTILTGKQQGSALGTYNVINMFPQDLQADLFDLDWTGEYYAGFGYHFRQAYAALEVFGRYSHNKTSALFQNNTTIATQIASENLHDMTTDIEFGPWHFGVDFRPGLFLGRQTVVYGRIGVQHSRIKLKSEVSTNGHDPNPFRVVASASDKKWKNAFRAGFGIEQHITSRLSFRTDYTYTDYGKLSVSASNSGFSAVPISVSDSKTIHLHSHTLLWGLSYYFTNCKNVGLIPCYSPSHFCGWYLGASGGAALFNGYTKTTLLTVSSILDAESHPNTKERNLVKGGGRGVILGGYSVQYRFLKIPFFTALEAFAQYSPYSKTRVERQIFSSGFNPVRFSATTTHTTRIKIDDWQFGGDLRWGILLSPWSTIYATVGTAAARIHTQSDAFFFNPAPNSLDLRSSHKETRAILRAGCGIERALLGRWHLRFDYRFTDYRTLHLSGAIEQDFIMPTSSLSFNSSVHPKDHAITLGLSCYL